MVTGGWKRIACLVLLIFPVIIVIGCGETPTEEPDPTATPGVRILMPTPGTPPPSVIRMPTRAVITYIVQSGDTLSGIATRYGVTVDEIVEENDLANPDVLHPGDVLMIPVLEQPSVTPSP